ncbi:hypothetical protein ACFVMC_17190 [Nocardia sp. NPDC127579]|uniref:hypothetical protein n=1 Tax=Nocardia sp. NPDC127579 TaxID=3345402 RepID=UPI00364533C0
MAQRRWGSRSITAVAGLCVAAALAACTTSGDPSPAETTTSSARGSTSAAAPTKLEISDAGAKQLCDLIQPELSNWRVQGPTLGKIGLNALVHQWGLQQGGINGHILQDKSIVDTVTTKACPDVRQQAVDALELPNLAAGIAF